MLNRDKLLLGVYSLPEKLYTDPAIAQLKEMGPDYIVLAMDDPRLVALCEKYHLSVFISNRLPCGGRGLWLGGNGSGAGHFHEFMPASMAQTLKDKPDSPAIAGDYVVDEPSSLDFQAINDFLTEYKRLYPSKLPMINLYPNYASVAETTGSQRVNQLGNPTYREHIQQYIREIDLDYLSMDYYPFHDTLLTTFIDNLRVCADACRDSQRDFWYIFQAGAWTKEEQIAPFQLKWQCYLGLAFGARSLQAACYYHAWWHPECGCVNDEGERNPMYFWVKDIFAELNRLSPAYMPYRYTGAYLAGNAEDAAPMLQKDLSALPHCGVEADFPAVVGRLRARDGREALVVVNCRDPWDEKAGTKITVPASRLRLWRNGYAQILTGDGKIEFALSGGEGVLAELNA